MVTEHYDRLEEDRSWMSEYENEMLMRSNCPCGKATGKDGYYHASGIYR